jgi:hypothetical protein
LPQAIAAGASDTDTISVKTNVKDLGFEQAESSDPNAAVTYYVYAFADAKPDSNYGLDLGTSTSGSFAVANPPAVSGGGDTLALSLPTTSLNAVSFTDPLSFSVNVTRNGNPEPAATLTFSVTNLATGGVSTTPGLTWDGAAGVVNGYGRNLDGNPGMHVVSVVAHYGSLTATTDATVTIPVKYGQLVIDTYDPSGTGFGNIQTDLYSAGSAGSLTWETSADANGFNPDENNASYAYILWQPAGGLAPGVYYVRIRAMADGDAAPYVIRVGTTEDAYSKGTLRPSDWIPGVQNTSDANPAGPGYEPDGDLNGPASTAPVLSISDVSGAFMTASPEYLNRYIAAGTFAADGTLTSFDVDWVRVVVR